MRRVKCCIGFAAIAAWLIGCSDIGGSEPVSESSQELFGDQSENNTQLPTLATALLTFNDNGSCSAVLVEPNMLLTAAHCFCGSDETYSAIPAVVQFANNNGVVQSTQWPVVSWVLHPRVATQNKMCGTVNRNGVDDPAHNAPWDLAVITIASSPTTGALPPFTPIEPFLGNIFFGELTGQLRTSVTSGGVTTSALWLAGYGDNAPLSWTPDRCVGCNTRRSGSLNSAAFTTRRAGGLAGGAFCDPFGLLLFYRDCYTNYMITAQSIETPGTANIEISSGDSGGGIFYNVGSAIPTVVAGIASIVSRDFADLDAQRWAPTGDDDGAFETSDWLAATLGRGFARTLANTRARAAIRATGDIRINDRAHVEDSPDEFGTGSLVAGGYVRLGVEAVVEGDVDARGDVEMADRSRVDGFSGVRSSLGVQVGNGASAAGGISAGVYMRFEDFNLSVPFTAGTTPLTVANDGHVELFAGGDVGDVVVRARGSLTVHQGLHVWKSLLVEHDAHVSVSSDTWIFVMDGGHSVMLRGFVHSPVVQGKATFLLGAPNATSVIFGSDFTGALVAPNAWVTADMVDGAVLVGSFHVANFELHQGRFLKHRPFAGNWIPSCDPTFFICS